MSSTDGSSTVTGEKRRASAESRSILRYSASVVAPITRSSPRASSGLRMLAASIAPSGAPAPSTVCSSSRNRMILPSDSMASSSASLKRFSNWPRNWAPAIMPRQVERDDPRLVRASRGPRCDGSAGQGPRRWRSCRRRPRRSARRCSCAGGRGSRRSARSRRSRPMTGSIRPAGGIGRQVAAELVERGLALGGTALDLVRALFAQHRRAPSAPAANTIRTVPGRRPQAWQGWVLKISVTVTEISNWLHTQCDGAHGRFGA